MAFTGHYEHTLDDKGRITLPARLREVLTRQYDERMFVTLSANGIQALDRCLHLYPRVEFERVLAALSSAPASDPAVVAYKRLVVNHAEEVTVDRQGRVLLPALLRERVGIEREIVLVGDLKVIQVWSRQEWARALDVEQIVLANRDRLAQYGL